MIKKKSIIACAMAMTMMVSAPACAETIASGVTPIVTTGSSEVTQSAQNGTAAETTAAEKSTGIVEATGVLAGSTTETSAAGTGSSTAQTGSSASAGGNVTTIFASMNQTGNSASTGSGSTGPTAGSSQTSLSSSGSTTGAAGTSIGTGSSGPTVPGSTNLTNFFGTGSSSSGASNALGALSTIPLPAGYYCSNVGTYTYEEMLMDLNTLKANYPSMQMDVLATTVDGRQLYHVVVGNPSAPHKILVHGGIHAREYISSQVVMREIVSLLEMQKSGLLYHGQSMATLLQNTCIHFVPMVNPDGIALEQGGIDALNTQAAKTMVMSMAAQDGITDLSSYLRKWKNNVNGVNLNRNFDAYWQEAAAKIDHPSNTLYKGTAPESEIESKALADLCRRIMPDYTISYHTQGRVIYWYFGETGSYKAKGQYLANVVHQNTGYTISNTWSQTDAAGFKDWAVMKLDIPSVTIEVGRGTSPVEETQITQIWDENDGILPDLLVGMGA